MSRFCLVATFIDSVPATVDFPRKLPTIVLSKTWNVKDLAYFIRF